MPYFDIFYPVFAIFGVKPPALFGLILRAAPNFVGNDV